MLTIEDVKNSKPEMIYYSANTVWWTHDPKDLKKGPIPLDPFNSPLFQMEKIEDFLDEAAISSQGSYGEPDNRIRNFMMSHAKNIHLACDKMPYKSFSLIKDFSVFSKWCDDNL